MDKLISACKPDIEIYCYDKNSEIGKVRTPFMNYKPISIASS